MYKLRLKILLCIFAAVFLIVLVRLMNMQVFNGEQYREQAQRNLSKFNLIPGQRGKILDRNGVILATDEACHDFCLDYRFIVGDSKWRKRQIRNIAKNRGITKAEAEEVFNRADEFTWQIAGSLARERGEDLQENVRRLCRNIARMRRSVGRDIREMRSSHAVVSGLSEGQVNSLRPLLGKMAGVQLEPSHKRFYPYADVACHIIGSTRRVFAKDLQKNNLTEEQADRLTRMRKNYRPSDTIGESGVERAAEKLLRFTRGYRKMSRPGEVSKIVPATNGQDVQLTIDIELQRYLTKVFANTGHTGSVVVVDVKTGEILAMVSWPTYDLNKFRRLYNSLLEDTTNLPLHHRAIYNAYAPGSTIKPFTGLAACAMGKLTPGQLVTCTGKNPYSRDGRPRCYIYRHYHTTHGPLDLSTAIKKSCNIYFVRASHMIGPKALSYWLHDFGFGEYPNTGLVEDERKGICADEEYLKNKRGRGFYPSDAWFMCMGQGVFSATPLQVAAAMSAIARRGEYRSPVLMKHLKNTQQVRDLKIPSNAINAVFDGMHRVINEHGGTAYNAWRLGAVSEVDACGKTGTAQVPPMRIDSNDDDKITTADTVVKSGDMAWFTGFAPFNDPQVAISVVVEYSQDGGGTAAAPIAKEALSLCKKFGYIK